MLAGHVFVTVSNSRFRTLEKQDLNAEPVFTCVFQTQAAFCHCLKKYSKSVSHVKREGLEHSSTKVIAAAGGPDGCARDRQTVHC
jgi:hypothetical protein